MKKLIWAALMLATLLVGQEKKWQQKFVEVKTGNVIRLANLLATIPGLKANGDAELRVISLGTDSPEVMQAAEEMIKRFDRPSGGTGSGAPRNFELTVHLLLAGKELKVGDALPPDLEPVGKQLRSVFGFKDLQLLDTAFLRNREDVAGMLSGTVTVDSVPGASVYNFSYQESRVAKDERGNIVRLGKVGLRFQTQIATSSGGWQGAEVRFDTSLDLREGQKVVIGKSRIGADQRSLIVVLTAKVAD